MFCSVLASSSFQSTHPVGGGTNVNGIREKADDISIHPPRGGWDPDGNRTRTSRMDFNPPTPWGVGRGTVGISAALAVFQSTHPVGGWDKNAQLRLAHQRISIHPPRGGWDP